jgi:hypothetical protein
MPPIPRKPAVNDPLEGSKLESLRPPQPKTAAPPPEPAPTPVVNPPPVQAPPPVVAGPPPKRAKRYRVKARTTVSLNGQLLNLAADDILSADSYGDEGMKRLLGASIPLEELP